MRGRTITLLIILILFGASMVGLLYLKKRVEQLQRDRADKLPAEAPVEERLQTDDDK